MNVGESVRYNYTGNIQQFQVENAGVYKLEVYAGQGGDIVNNGTQPKGGNGGKAIGYIKLKKGTTLYIGVGSRPSYVGGASRFDYRSSASGGYNGGGSGRCSWDASGHISGGASGGATHIALTNRGTLPNYSNNQDEVLIIAGGGGGASGYWASSGAGFSGATGGTGGGNGYGQGASAPSSPTAARQSAGGGGFSGGSRDKGGTNSVANVPSFTYKGTTYSPSTSNGVNSGNGYAIITFMAKSSALKFGNKDVDVYYGNKEVVVNLGNKELG